jgi:PAS domain S-box-containing protein
MSPQGVLNFHQFCEGVGDALLLCDISGRILYWNPAAVRIFGFTQEEALGQSLDLIIPERQRQRHWEGYAKTMESGVTRYGTQILHVPALHKSGKTLSIGFSVGLMKDGEGKVTGISAVVRDETEEFARQRELRAKLEEFRRQLAERQQPPA